GIFEQAMAGWIDALGRAGVVFQIFPIESLVDAPMGDELDAAIGLWRYAPARIEEVDAGAERQHGQARPIATLHRDSALKSIVVAKLCKLHWLGKGRRRLSACSNRAGTTIR